MMLAVLAVIGAVAGSLAFTEQQKLAKKIVRLHVRANSDTEEDQTVKLQVRDAILQQVQNMTADCETSQKAVCRLSDNLPALAQTAAATLQNLGRPDKVRVSLCKETFPTRDYDTFSLPAGNYTALRVDIGEAAGHNWWCVVFPTLCQSATAEDFAQTAAAGELTADEIELLTAQTPRVQMKFRFLEWITNLFSE